MTFRRWKGETVTERRRRLSGGLVMRGLSVLLLLALAEVLYVLWVIW